ncbi:MAG: Ser-Thr-rich GPI-anchored membrane family protein, partial [bacterium]
CLYGACQPISDPGSCSETDNALDYYTKGTATGKNNWDGLSGYYADSCLGNILTEYQCSNNLVAKSNYSCSNGCSNGACQQSTSQTCSETDNALDYYTKGTASGKNNWDGLSGYYADSCLGNILTEYQCSNSLVAKSNYSCPSGCSNGACAVISATCYETDNALDYYTKGTASGKNNWDGLSGYYADSCLGNILTEYQCSNNLVEKSNYSCSNGCSNGACVICYETDNALDYYTKGMATGPNNWDGLYGSYTDSCSGNTLTEYQCSNNLVEKSNYSCSGGCSNGACATIIPTCFDNDNGLYGVKGTTTGKNSWDGSIGSYTDSCSGYTLSEYLCNNRLVIKDDFLCSQGCSNGACLLPALFWSVVSPADFEQWERGTIQQIKWENFASSYFFPDPEFFDISLTKPGAAEYFIAKNVGGQSYNWTVGDAVGAIGGVPNGDYKVQLCRAGTTVCSSSNPPYLIITDPVPPSITLTNPNGGEKWVRGAFVDIGWNSSYADAGPVNISLKKESSGVVKFVAGDIPANRYGYTWQVPVGMPTGLDYKVKLEATDRSYQNPTTDESDSYFSILASMPCSETDSGQDYYTGGTTTGQAEEGNYYNHYKDYCSGNILTEYYCSDTGSVKHVRYVCPDGSAVDDCWGIIPAACRQ